MSIGPTLTAASENRVHHLEDKGNGSVQTDLRCTVDVGSEHLHIDNIYRRHSPSSRVRLSERELRSEGFVSSDKRGEKALIRDFFDNVLFIQSDTIYLIN